MKVHGHDPEGGQGPQNGQEKLHAQARKRMARGQETRDQAQKRQDKDTVSMRVRRRNGPGRSLRPIMDKRRWKNQDKLDEPWTEDTDGQVDMEAQM